MIKSVEQIVMTGLALDTIEILGSILGPLLFIVFVNDICNVTDLMFAIMYADDTCFF